jgi:hypothetical protein
VPHATLQSVNGCPDHDDAVDDVDKIPHWEGNIHSVAVSVTLMSKLSGADRDGRTRIVDRIVTEV